MAPYAGVAGGALVSKHGVGAVLVPAPESKNPDDPAVAHAVHPGMMVRGEVARLLDRGYQKFIKTSQYELPASASQLQAIHAFSEELKQLTGAISLYNESLGTTSDVYRYDRLVGRELTGREDAAPAPAEPWDPLAPGIDRRALIPRRTCSEQAMDGRTGGAFHSPRAGATAPDPRYSVDEDSVAAASRRMACLSGRASSI